MDRVVVFGATSAVAIQCARLFAKKGSHLLLIGRNTASLENISSDLKVRGAMMVDYIQSDLADIEGHETLLGEVYKRINEPNVFLFAYGTLPIQEDCVKSADKTLDSIKTNCLSQISMLTLLSNHLEKRKVGTIAVITSVAGDRGRQSNYVYGASKGMLSIFLQGMRNRLDKSGVSVIDVKPGFIDTPMTSHIEKKGLLWANPEKVAKDIVAAISKGRDRIYTPWFWSVIMLVIRNIPERIFKKLTL